MTTEQLSRLKDELTRNRAMICFNGAFVHSIIEEIGNALRRYMESAETQKSAAMDVFSVYIEQAQNVRNYLARKRFADPSHNDAIIVISRKGERYVISSGNIVEVADVAELTARLESVARLDQEGLRKLFRERLRAEPRPGHASGAGGADKSAESPRGTAASASPRGTAASANPRGTAAHYRGANMGLIEIARRCTETLQYAFHEVDDGHRLFCLTAVV